ncbi:hypothetical protein [Streptomyces milbemycinicus]|uniref:hypothetical protein n=1 Tax=Streptomyces milbemycinicus TaxID=476552 RepID=UPI0033D7197E
MLCDVIALPRGPGRPSDEDRPIGSPRPFAVVQQYGQEEDARVAAWGMAFDDHSEVTSVEGTLRISTTSPERAARRFDRKPHVSARLVWLVLAGTATFAP